MFNKLYEKIKKILKNNYDVFITLIIFLFLVFFEFPYTISKPGGVIDTEDKVNVNSNLKMSGSLNMAYVSEVPANSVFMFFSFFNKDWDREKRDDSVITKKEENKINHLMLSEANNSALICALENADIDYEKKNSKVYVMYVDEKAKTDLTIGDEIIEVEGKEVSSTLEAYEVIKDKKINDKITFTVLDGKEEKNKSAILTEFDGVPKVGISLYESYKIKTDEKISFSFKNSESGGSGGLMMALTIYSKLVEEDLTEGMKIVGTGTIDEKGNVGEIGGVKYKLLGAISENADVFLVPEGDNYKEAMKIKKERNLKIKIKKVKTFSSALEYLRSLDYE